MTALWACCCGDWHPYEGEHTGRADAEHQPADDLDELLPAALGRMGWDR